MFNSNTGYSLADIAAVTNGANSHCCSTGSGYGYGNGMWGGQLRRRPDAAYARLSRLAGQDL